MKKTLRNIYIGVGVFLVICLISMFLINNNAENNVAGQNRNATKISKDNNGNWFDDIFLFTWLTGNTSNRGKEDYSKSTGKENLDESDSNSNYVTTPKYTENSAPAYTENSSDSSYSGGDESGSGFSGGFGGGDD